MNTTLLPAPDLARAAAAEFCHRQARAERMVRAGTLTAANATRALRPWLALACLAGADLPELEDGLAELRVCQIFPEPLPGRENQRPLPGRENQPPLPDRENQPPLPDRENQPSAGRDEAQARAILAADICPSHLWRAELIASRDAGLAAADTNPAAAPRARALAALADWAAHRTLVPNIPIAPQGNPA